MLAASPTIRVWRCGDVTNKLHGKEATMSTNNKKIKKDTVTHLHITDSDTKSSAGRVIQMRYEN